MTTDLNLLTATDFSPFLNQKLSIRFSKDKKQEVELIEVTEGHVYSQTGKRSFSLIVRASEKETYYGQAIFILEHPVRGELPVFFVPIGADQSGMRYQAVFS